MVAIPEDRRITELRRLGVSEPMVRLSSGEVVHEMFRHIRPAFPHLRSPASLGNIARKRFSSSFKGVFHR